MIFDVKIIEKTTGNIINLKNVSREYLDKVFKDRITEMKPKRKAYKNS